MGTDFLEQVPDPYPTWSDLPYSGVPWPFYVRNAKDVVIRDSRIEWADECSGAWQPEIVKCENANVTVERVVKVNFTETDITSPPRHQTDNKNHIYLSCGLDFFYAQV